jgi:hypothetical protein
MMIRMYNKAGVLRKASQRRHPRKVSVKMHPEDPMNSTSDLVSPAACTSLHGASTQWALCVGSPCHPAPGEAQVLTV